MEQPIDRIPISDVIELIIPGAGKGSNPNFVWKVGGNYSIGKGRRAICSSVRHDANSYFFNGQSRWTVYVKPIVNGDTPEEAEAREEWPHVHYENAELHIKCDIPDII